MVGSPTRDDGSRLLRQARIPIVETWDLPAAPIDAVAGFDNYKAGVAVARHLVAQGQATRLHRRRRSACNAPLARLQG
jgi:LacI family gluconate utilization system Gnt-I transcriptional repressor